MVNKEFEVYKLKRELLRSGIEVKVKRRKVNMFGEPSEAPEVIGFLQGLYHEQNSNIQITTSDAIQIRTKKIPMILCLFYEIECLSIKPGDFIIMNGKEFKVTGIVNIQEWNLIADVSLEVVDDGT